MARDPSALLGDRLFRYLNQDFLVRLEQVADNRQVRSLRRAPRWSAPSRTVSATISAISTAAAWAASATVAALLLSLTVGSGLSARRGCFFFLVLVVLTPLRRFCRQTSAGSCDRGAPPGASRPDRPSESACAAFLLPRNHPGRARPSCDDDGACHIPRPRSTRLQPARCRAKRRRHRNRCRLLHLGRWRRCSFVGLLLLAPQSKQPEFRRRQRINVVRSAAITLEFGAFVLRAFCFAGCGLRDWLPGNSMGLACGSLEAFLLHLVFVRDRGQLRMRTRRQPPQLRDRPSERPSPRQIPAPRFRQPSPARTPASKHSAHRRRALRVGKIAMPRRVTRLEANRCRPKQSATQSARPACKRMRVERVWTLQAPPFHPTRLKHRHISSAIPPEVRMAPAHDPGRSERSRAFSPRIPRKGCADAWISLRDFRFKFHRTRSHENR